MSPGAEPAVGSVVGLVHCERLFRFGFGDLSDHLGKIWERACVNAPVAAGLSFDRIDELGLQLDLCGNEFLREPWVHPRADIFEEASNGDEVSLLRVRQPTFPVQLRVQGDPLGSNCQLDQWPHCDQWSEFTWARQGVEKVQK